MTPEQCLALVAADTRVREAARDVVAAFQQKPKISFLKMNIAAAKLAVVLAEFDRAEKESK